MAHERCKSRKSPDGELVLPLSLEIIKNVFEWLATDTDLPKRGRSKKKAPAPEREVEITSSILLGRDEVDSDDEGFEDTYDMEADVDEEILSVLEASKKSITISTSCMQGYKSALKHEYSRQGVTMCSTIDKWIEDFMDGYGKLIQEKKELGIMKLKEGRSHLSFRGYCHIALWLVTIKNNSVKKIGRGFTPYEYIFAAAFMILSWNLMARVHSVGSIRFDHFDWVEDCMTITYARSKSDRHGTAAGNTKHVYANPKKPEICPILNLAIYIFCSNKVDNNNILFHGEYSEDRFCKILKKVLDTMPGIAEIMGVSSEVR